MYILLILEIGILSNVEDSIGSIQIQNNKIISNSATLNTNKLFCGETKDKPLQIGILSLNQNLFYSLQNIQNDDTITSILEYIQCSEAIYFAVANSAAGSDTTIDLFNDILI